MSAGCSRVDNMADGTFVAVVNDTNPNNGGRSYNLTVSGNNQSQFLGKRIGDVVDGIFVGEGDKTLAGYKLEITGGSDKTGTPMRSKSRWWNSPISSCNRINRFQGTQPSPQGKRWREEEIPLQA